jgi:gentisate 1,2-dioxygenase
VANVPSKANDTQEALLNDINGSDVEPLWTRMAQLNPPLPSPKAIAHKWE